MTNGIDASPSYINNVCSPEYLINQAKSKFASERQLSIDEKQKRETTPPMYIMPKRSRNEALSNVRVIMHIFSNNKLAVSLLFTS